MVAIPRAESKAARLADLRKGDRAVVTGFAPESEEASALQARFVELGFAPGESVEVVAESFPRGDPMAVRLGNTILALRRREARAVVVDRDDAECRTAR